MKKEVSILIILSSLIYFGLVFFVSFSKPADFVPSFLLPPPQKGSCENPHTPLDDKYNVLDCCDNPDLSDEYKISVLDCCNQPSTKDWVKTFLQCFYEGPGGGSPGTKPKCDDDNLCTKDYEVPVTSQPTNPPTTQPTYECKHDPLTGPDCTLGNGQTGFCKNGVCTEKKCDNVFEPGKYIECPAGSNACCDSDLQQCCGGNTCCNKEFRPSNAPPGYVAEKCSALGLGICIAQKDSCEKDGFPPNGGKLCEGTYKDVCCPKKHPDGTDVVCGDEHDVPFCGYKRNEKDKCPDGKNPCNVEKFTFEKDVIECCDNSETCVWVDGRPGCSKTKIGCGSDFYCNGAGENNKYASVAICCKAGEVCFRDGDGWPRCKRVLL